MNPDKTDPFGVVCSGSILYAIKATLEGKQERELTTIVANGRKSINMATKMLS